MNSIVSNDWRWIGDDFTLRSKPSACYILFNGVQKVPPANGAYACESVCVLLCNVVLCCVHPLSNPGAFPDTQGTAVNPQTL